MPIYRAITKNISESTCGKSNRDIRRRLGHSSLAKDEHNYQILGVDHLTFEGGGVVEELVCARFFFSLASVFFTAKALQEFFFISSTSLQKSNGPPLTTV